MSDEIEVLEEEGQEKGSAEVEVAERENITSGSVGVTVALIIIQLVGGAIVLFVAFAMAFGYSAEDLNVVALGLNIFAPLIVIISWVFHFRGSEGPAIGLSLALAPMTIIVMIMLGKIGVFGIILPVILLVGWIIKDAHFIKSFRS